ncbi:hypothetical protein PFICI_11668 [Pestalotiopsis fici W106-1]|uniref:AB hydrolase-1 domain-containing protein n=1 Tax=Pestalotiopsis fici (strain W106-1 / CGMCC3.15140) TaxID=1229662 RepID=W3WTX3_PESFW|nr:uncharacterized protein PFICI_11668 [Pestalotiopsis fici W106-1]ETS76281.1 hypothetical protein PFICI_11668 [Pestalotiopsis fici W106-1]
MTQLTPTVLFVHGSWHTPLHFAKIREIFEDAGYPTSCPRQPTVGASPPIGLLEDAQCIRDEVQRLVNEDKDVIVIAHSYGGVVTTQAVEVVFSKKKRLENGQRSGVLSLVYMCAFMLSMDTSLAGTFEGKLPPWITIHKPVDGGTVFYHDVDPDERKQAVQQLLQVPAVTQITPITHLAYLHHPVRYLYCTDDQALPYAAQQMMVQNVCKQYGISFAEHHLNASHSPFLSMPERVLEVVQQIAEDDKRREIGSM